MKKGLLKRLKEKKQPQSGPTEPQPIIHHAQTKTDDKEM